MSDRLWLTKAEAAEMLGIKERWFDQSIRSRLVGPSAVQEKPLRFHAAAVHKAGVDVAIEKRAPLDPEDAAIYAGGDSIELEKLRAIKRQREELAYQKDLGLVVELSSIRPLLQEFARQIRESSTRLVKQCGNEAGEIVNECLDEYQATVDRHFAESPPSDGGPAKGNGGAKPAKAPAKAKGVRRRRNRHSHRPVRRKKVQD
jgi:hypothetical protein